MIVFIINLTEVVVALETSLNHPWRAVLKQSLSIVCIHDTCAYMCVKFNNVCVCECNF